jgi:hypothetical protein
MAEKKSAGEAFRAYDRATNRKMAEHNRTGGEVRKPVRDVSAASDEAKYDRGKFLERKAGQALSQNHPLKDDNGNPTLNPWSWWKHKNKRILTGTTGRFGAPFSLPRASRKGGVHGLLRLLTAWSGSYLRPSFFFRSPTSPWAASSTMSRTRSKPWPRP